MTAVRPPRPRGRRATRPSGDERESAILTTLERMLEERPFAEISVDDLAKGAGLSRPTFYFYFASKEAVLVRLFARMIADIDPARHEGAGTTLAEDPEAVWREGIFAFFDALRPHRAVALAGLAAMANNEELRHLWSAFMTAWVDYTAELITAERGPRRGPGHHSGTRSGDGPESDERAGGVRLAGHPEPDTAGGRRVGGAGPRVGRQHLWTVGPADLSPEFVNGRPLFCLRVRKRD